MSLHSLGPQQGGNNDYLVSRSRAWFAFAMTFALMLFDYIDRQVIVSMFPHLKAAWGLSDKQLGALVSIVSVVVALGAMPVALLADRVSRVKSVVVMAGVWSLATISCMFTRNYAQLFAARAVVGVGESGYGSVGAALIGSLFPARLRSMLLGAFFAAGSIGAVLGVVLGGVITARWGWEAAFGVVGVPGLLLAVLYLFVPDYKTVALQQSTGARGGTLAQLAAALTSSRTLWWTCLGAALQLVVVSTVWAWLPSYFHRAHGTPVDQAAMQAALIVLCSAAGSFFWGVIADLFASSRPRNKLTVLASLCLLTTPVLVVAFGAAHSMNQQFLLIALGGFLMTCAVGPASGVVLDVVHPGLRSTGAAVLSLFQNLFGLAIGPFVGGALSDALGLQMALTIMPAFGVLAALCFRRAARTYEGDLRKMASAAADTTQSAGLAPSQAA
ncbi:Sialic acid transporter NanT [Cupriavidus yeoncheonensis]|uniref:Sialic acid transporter NanT n=1 Tax=Cupriavidus yeoncheonensis TaxID=1462994 RepID=A0A916MXK5_9BURK|nr:MFS transporter [Cupriavidus yeoncheonensis]CAG2154865.1 Sialic acid transporter NanT [Cupriavidus yeoncheonensis]